MHYYRIYINPHCQSCEALVTRMQTAVTARGYPVPETVSVLDDLETAVRLRITRVPALVHNDRLVAQGAVGRQALQRAIGQQEDRHD